MWCCCDDSFAVNNNDIRMKSFMDKVVLVTGANSGIGAAIALQAVKEGADVVMVGRNEVKLNKVSAECEKNGQKPLVIKADVSKDDDVKRIIDTTINTYGKLDVLVNNAGFMKYGSFLSVDALEDFDSLMSTNLRGVVNLTYLSAPHLIKTKGNIVNISSVGVMKNVPNAWSYSTSKAALDHFSKCIAAELAHKGVRVNVVNPGPVKTDIAINMGMTDEMMKELSNEINDFTALQRISDSREIADVVMLLADDKAKGITGSFVSCVR